MKKNQKIYIVIFTGETGQPIVKAFTSSKKQLEFARNLEVNCQLTVVTVE